jgi:LacI family gluconate utilization system Gnt-I transcriptional repressor
MADVARLASVSLATVSRYHSAPASVSPQVRARIAEAVDSLGYLPNVMAGGLASQRSRALAAIVPTLTNSVFAAMLEELVAVLSPNGYQVMVGSHDYDLKREHALVRSFLSWSPVGIVLVGRHHARETLRLLIADGLPVVEVGDYLDGAIDSNIGFSHRRIGRTVAQHFIARGARRLGLVTVAMPGDRRAADRADGVRDLVAQSGLALEEFCLSERASSRAGATGFAELMARKQRPDAIFFSNDLLCLGGLHEAHRRGIRVPDDVKLCGYGDFDFAATTMPSLSSVRPPDREIGRHTGEWLLKRFAGNDEAVSIDLGFKHVVRQSG